jgi:Flp pilus assembly protein TadG
MKKAIQLLLNREGVAALEFALLMPFMIALWGVIIEYSNLQAAARKVNIAAQSLADVIAQEEFVTRASLNRALEIPAVIMRPYPSDSLITGIQSIEADRNGNISVGWRAGNGLDIEDIVGDLVGFNESTIHVEVRYQYRPVLGNMIPTEFLPALINLKQVAYARPRLTTIIPLRR